MLRSRLYIGMLPVAGLLALVCLYSVYKHNEMGERLDDLQTNQYAAISETERLLLATSHIERAIRLKEDGEPELARSAFGRSEPVLAQWLEARSEESLSSDLERQLFLLVRNLRSFANSAFNAKVRFPDREKLVPLVQRIEAIGRQLLVAHNEEILLSNQQFRDESRTHFYVVVVAIVASVFLMGYVAYSLSQRILAPIDALTESAGRLGDDAWETDYKPSSKDEIARLELAFVEMAKRIREYRRITSREIVRTRRRMEQCFSNLPHPVLFLNAEREVAYMNPAAERLVRGHYWSETVLPELQPRIEKVFGTGEGVVDRDFEQAVSVKIDNEMQYFLPIFVRVDSDEAKDIECGVVLQDVTRLRLSDELKSDWVATVSHEIKTPVTSVTMALHLVLEKSLGDLTPDQEDMLQTANGDLNRLKRLLNHLLEIARLESSQPTLNRVYADPIHIARLVVEAYTMQAKSRQVQLEISIEDELPKVHVDVKAMEVGLSNFLSNAIKYSPEGSRIEVYAERMGGAIRFGVRDEGPGIPEEDTEKVFEKFYRSSCHRSLEGIGLGLSIVRDIARAHGGSAGCLPRQPTGCDFYLEIADESEK